MCSIMEERLVARAAKRKRRCNSYEGEIAKAPENLLRDERGGRHFRVGKVYLSLIVDCFDGMPLGQPVFTSPDAEMANFSLLRACGRLGEGNRPKIHSDRGSRWPGWVKICEKSGLARSMFGKRCGPDSARCEGFFGLLKIEFLCRCDWAEIAIGEFIETPDAYLRWHRDIRVKSQFENGSMHIAR